MERRSGIGSAHHHGPTTTPPTGPKSSREAVGGAVSGARSVHSPTRKGHRGEASPSSRGRHPSPLGGDQSGQAGGNGGRGRRVMRGGRSSSGSKRLGRAVIGEGSKAGAPREDHAAVGGGEREDEDSGAAAPFPGFDELSRWRVTRGSVSRMVRLAGEVSTKEPSLLSVSLEPTHPFFQSLSSASPISWLLSSKFHVHGFPRSAWSRHANQKNR